MLSIQLQHSTTTESAELNLLPCRVRHAGPANATEKHWRVHEGDTAYFRGRKLVGKRIGLPGSYSGHVLAATDEIALPGSLEKPKRNCRVEEVEEENEKKTQELKVFKELSTFDGITMWGHDAVPDESSEYVMKAMKEWVGLANKIHSFSEDEGDKHSE